METAEEPTKQQKIQCQEFYSKLYKNLQNVAAKTMQKNGKFRRTNTKAAKTVK